MNLNLSGKTAIVTGGGSGIGKAVSFLLAEEGAYVAVLDLYSERASAVAATIRSTSSAFVRSQDKNPGADRRAVAAVSTPS